MYKDLIKPYQYYTPIYPTPQKPPQYQTSRTSPIERSSSGLRPMTKEEKRNAFSVVDLSKQLVRA